MRRILARSASLTVMLTGYNRAGGRWRPHRARFFGGFAVLAADRTFCRRYGGAMASGTVRPSSRSDESATDDQCGPSRTRCP